MAFQDTKYILVPFLAFFLQSCLDAPNATNMPVTNIDSELQIYVDRFYEEASARDRNLENESLIAVFTDSIIVNGETFCGYGRHDIDGSGQATVDIVMNGNCWNSRSDKERENLVFHELGHALLRRFHFENLLPNGAPESMMCGECNNFIAYNQFQDYKRTYYLDELLIPGHNEVPGWALPKSTETIVFEQGFEEDTLRFVPFIDYADTAFISLDTTGVLDGNSLLIESNPNESEGIISFPISIGDQNPAECSDIVLTADIQAKINSGPGAFMALQGYQNINDETNLLQSKVKNSVEASGFTNDTVRLGCISEQADEIVIFLYLSSETSGEAYFDNLKVSILE